MDKLKKLSIVGIAVIVLFIVISSTVVTNNPFDDIQNFFSEMPDYLCSVFVVYIIIWFIVAYWVEKDAYKHGMDGDFWATAVLFLGFFMVLPGFIALCIYFVLKGRKMTSQQSVGVGRMCPSCGKSIPMNSNVCPFCGKDFRPPKT